MMNHRRAALAALAMGHLLVSTTVSMAVSPRPEQAQLPLSIQGEIFHSNAMPDAEPRLQLPFDAAHHSIRLSAVGGAERAAKIKSSADKTHAAPMIIGIGRDVPPELSRVDLRGLPWQVSSEGVRTARIVVESPAAKAVRAELSLQGLSEGIRFRFGNPDQDAEAFGPFSAADIDRMSNWSPVVEGSRIAIDIDLVDGATAAGRVLVIPHVAHHDVSTYDNGVGLKADDPYVGRSGSCNIDVACVASQLPAAAKTASAVARMVFIFNGNPARCTGQLINSTSSSGQSQQVPYFITANHCIANSTAAGSIQFAWFFQSTACRGTTDPNAKTTVGGGALLYTNVAVDATLLRLNVPPPDGVFMAGWDATPPMPGESIFSLHHPQGDLTKFSAGTIATYGRFCDAVDRNDQCTRPQGSFIQVNWSQGTTEGGSSGSGVYTVDSSGGYRLRGVLHGGGAACEFPNDPDYFSRFDLVYPAVSPILAGVAQPSAGPNAIEYYNVNLDHYFLTSFTAEAAAIESGSAGAGWARTGYAFPIGTGPTATLLPVCRFYGPSPNSHFYTAEAGECAQVKKDPGWVYEGTAFNIGLPSAGGCPANMIPIYRAYNNGFVDNNSNHRYTTNQYMYQWQRAQPSVVSVFLGRPESAARWSGEATVMCAPLAG